MTWGGDTYSCLLLSHMGLCRLLLLARLGLELPRTCSIFASVRVRSVCVALVANRAGRRWLTLGRPLLLLSLNIPLVQFQRFGSRRRFPLGCCRRSCLLGRRRRRRHLLRLTGLDLCFLLLAGLNLSRTCSTCACLGSGTFCVCGSSG